MKSQEDQELQIKKSLLMIDEEREQLQKQKRKLEEYDEALFYIDQDEQRFYEQLIESHENSHDRNDFEVYKEENYRLGMKDKENLLSAFEELEQKSKDLIVKEEELFHKKKTLFSEKEMEDRYGY
ncbi:hypothetical protein [Enterococcus sp. LJL51]|uniref:hypothetical protein n=1 Tax=Enterococcus sp. LJL51 TaxID=3416656 RepID=UPI003CFAA097